MARQLLVWGCILLEDCLGEGYIVLRLAGVCPPSLGEASQGETHHTLPLVVQLESFTLGLCSGAFTTCAVFTVCLVWMCAVYSLSTVVFTEVVCLCAVCSLCTVVRTEPVCVWV